MQHAGAVAMGLNPDEAAMLGGTATLSTQVDGKPSRRLVFNIFVQGLEASSPLFTVAALLALILKLRAAISKETMASCTLLLVAFLLAGVLAFVAPVLWGLRPETVEMGRDRLRVRTGEKSLEIPWSAVRELRATTKVSYMSRRYVGSRPAVIVSSDSGEYVMKWWRFPVEDQKRFFIFAATMVLPHQTPVVDDLHWLPADKAGAPSVYSKWEREYKMTVKAGGVLAVVGLVLMVGFAVGVPLLGAIGIGMLFIGGFSAAVGWAALDEQKKKRQSL